VCVLTCCLGSVGDDEALVWALWDSRAICVSDEVGEVFVGVGEHLVEIVICF
jgi:hypothetical protein